MICGLDGATSSAPMEATGWLSKIGVQTVPTSLVFQMPPPTEPKKKVRPSPGTPDAATERPPRNGPANRQLSPVKRSEDGGCPAKARLKSEVRARKRSSDIDLKVAGRNPYAFSLSRDRRERSQRGPDLSDNRSLALREFWSRLRYCIDHDQHPGSRAGPVGAWRSAGRAIAFFWCSASWHRRVSPRPRLGISQWRQPDARRRRAETHGRSNRRHRRSRPSFI